MAFLSPCLRLGTTERGDRKAGRSIMLTVYYDMLVTAVGQTDVHCQCYTLSSTTAALCGKLVPPYRVWSQKRRGES